MYLQVKILSKEKKKVNRNKELVPILLCFDCQKSSYPMQLSMLGISIVITQARTRKFAKLKFSIQSELYVSDIENTRKFGALRAPFARPSGMKRFWSLFFRYEEFQGVQPLGIISLFGMNTYKV